MGGRKDRRRDDQKDRTREDAAGQEHDRRNDRQAERLCERIVPPEQDPKQRIGKAERKVHAKIDRKDRLGRPPLEKGPGNIKKHKGDASDPADLLDGFQHLMFFFFHGSAPVQDHVDRVRDQQNEHKDQTDDVELL